MMRHFEVMTISGVRWLMEVDTSRWDFWLGFRRPIRRL